MIMLRFDGMANLSGIRTAAHRLIDPLSAAAPMVEAAVVSPVVAPLPALGRVDAKRARDHDHPDDNALYTCGCGMTFTAAVAAGTPCPHCGDGQPW